MPWNNLKTEIMNKKILGSVLLFFVLILNAQSQNVIGKWKTIDDVTGQAKSIVEIYEKSGKIFGKVIEIFDKERKNNLCSNCSGEDKNKPILGMTIIKGLSKEGDTFCNGKILDPKNGNLYKCSIVLEAKDKLKVHGYIGISLLGRTQYWFRAK